MSSETTSIALELEDTLSTLPQQQGLIAILDALGAANYSRDAINRFLNSRQIVLDQLRAKAPKVQGIDANLITTFTFNDTVVIVCPTNAPVSLKNVRGFSELVRRFAVKSLEHGILFRGSIAIGTFFVDGETNTVMGDAVTDAASWYDSTDWMGITATPQATLLIQSLIEQGGDTMEHLIVDYSVPMKDQRVIRLKAVNWPKAFFVKGITPCVGDEKPRAKCLALLINQGVPKGTESKYFNTMAFFDHCNKLRREQQKKKVATKPIKHKA
jgi:hypothetical protein